VYSFDSVVFLDCTHERIPGISPRTLSPKYAESAECYPYFGRFSEIWLGLTQVSAGGRPGVMTRSCSEEEVVRTLNLRAPVSTPECRQQPFHVVAMDARVVTRKLAFRAAMAGRPTNPAWWYAADYRDFESMVLPTGLDKVSMDEALSFLVPDRPAWSTSLGEQRIETMFEVMVKLSLFEGL
jgi:hypothetical protein